jgi:hypothetical protein
VLAGADAGAMGMGGRGGTRPLLASEPQLASVPSASHICAYRSQVCFDPNGEWGGLFLGFTVTMPSET